MFLSRMPGFFVRLLICAALSLPGVAADMTQPIAISRGAPLYPYSLIKQRIGGSAEVEFIVGADGSVLQAQAVNYTHPKFGEAAVAAVLRWRFKPGTKDGKPVNVRARQVITFEPPVRREVYPFDLAVAGQTGKATVGYWVGVDGRVIRTTVLSATDPAFGHATVAQIVDDMNAAPLPPEQRNESMYQMENAFALKGRDQWSAIDESARDILKRLKKADPGIYTPADLDKPPVPTDRSEPVYPPDLAATQADGSSVVEFFIDQKGRVQLPRAVSATQEEFGYAATQAIGQWTFNPPLRQGKPVIVRARVEIDFRPGGKK